jgi:hypothetical protein
MTDRRISQERPYDGVSSLVRRSWPFDCKDANCQGLRGVSPRAGNPTSQAWYGLPPDRALFTRKDTLRAMGRVGLDDGSLRPAPALRVLRPSLPLSLAGLLFVQSSTTFAVGCGNGHCGG